MAWQAEADIPFAVIPALYFSQIIGAEVYIIDRGFNFYKYHLGTQQYTALAPPPFIGTNLHRALIYRNNRLYCIDEGAALEPFGRRISWYDITTGVWASSSQVPSVGNFFNIHSFCFADDDTIWAWVKRNGRLEFRCRSYTISTDTWSAELVGSTGVIAVGGARSAIMNVAGTQVWGSQMGATPGRYAIYTIATNGYGFSADYAGINWCWNDDPIRLWYFNWPAALPAVRYGYMEQDGVTFHDAFWEGNPARAGGYFGHIGILGLDAIIDQASGVNPMTYSDGFLAPTVQTNPATSIINNSATLNATLDTGNLPCECYFEWGETPAYGKTTPIQTIAVDGPFAQTLYPLKPDTTYHFRAIATNTQGTSTGTDRSFTTLQVPYQDSLISPQVQTNPATLITEHTARLNGVVVEDGGVRGAVRFQWGLTTEYGANTSWQQGYGKGDEFFVYLNNLAEGQGFHFRAQFRVGGKLVSGSDMAFNTLSPLGPVTLVTDEILQLLEAK